MSLVFWLILSASFPLKKARFIPGLCKCVTCLLAYLSQSSGECGGAL